MKISRWDGSANIVLVSDKMRIVEAEGDGIAIQAIAPQSVINIDLTHAEACELCEHIAAAYALRFDDEDDGSDPNGDDEDEPKPTLEQLQAKRAELVKQLEAEGVDVGALFKTIEDQQTGGAS